jgi:hypothetical protein
MLAELAEAKKGQAPEKVRKVADQICTVVLLGTAAAKKFLPSVFMLALTAVGFYAQHGHYLAPLIVGSAFLLAGDQFLLTVAVYEAFMVLGYPVIKENLVLLYADYVQAMEAVELVQRKKHDLDGMMADAKNMSASDINLDASADGLAAAKAQAEAAQGTALVVQEVLDKVNPTKISRTFAGIYSAILAVFTVSSPTLRGIALGSSVGDRLKELAEPRLEAYLKKSVPQVYIHKWAHEAFVFGSKAIGVTFALILSGLLATMYSATKGAKLFVQGLEKAPFVPPLDADIVHYLEMGLVFLGFVIQLGQLAPGVVYLLLSPLMITEWLLKVIVE